MITILNKENIPELNLLSANNDDSKDLSYWPLCFEQQEQGLRTIFGWVEGGKIVGYAQFNRAPKYQPFSSAAIPEIQDVRVDRGFQRQGVATNLLYVCEALALEEGATMIGIGVGLDVRYGKAQRLYISLGYIPDGEGVNYDRVACKAGDIITLDDDVSLMLIKPLI
jgi:GNAT superfamily N-acetyltransferase